MAKKWKVGGLALLVCGLLAAGAAQAAVPATSLVEGTLNSNGGGPAADGLYALTFAIYKDELAQVPLWTEGPANVNLKGGQFSYVLGSTVPLKGSLLNGGAWLTMKVGGDPELPRKAMNSVVYALRAGVAEGLDCSGCIPAGALDPAILAGLVKGPLADVAKTGAYADLVGAPVIGKLCAANTVLIGFKADGSLDCVPAGAAGAPDSISLVSNGLIFNTFNDQYVSSKGSIDILDNDPVGVSDTIAVLDNGFAQKLTISLSLTNSDISGVSVFLYAPGNIKYTLFDQNGKKGDGIITTYPDNTKPLVGDLTTWLGKNPKGNWKLQVIDLNQGPGGNDGKFTWSVNVGTLSNKKIQVKGDLIVDGALTIAGGASGLLKQLQDIQTCSNPDPQGPCFAHFTGGRTFVEAAKYCGGLKADICTDSQAWAGRQLWTFAIALMPNWTNSWADNDGGQWTSANGGTSDDHPATSLYATPCCYNYSPTVPGEQKVGGIRVLKVNNSTNATWSDAVNACLSVQSDLCSKGDYYVLRQQGLISVPMWASDHSDNEGNVCSSSSGNTSDNTNESEKYGYACCATSRTSLTCPPGNVEIGGVCVAKLASGNSFTFNTAATNCASLGAKICSFSQTSVLRASGQLTGGGTWTASHSDSDSGYDAAAIGNVSDDPSDGQNYAYACCF